MEKILDTIDKKKFLITKIWEVANSDNDFCESEKELVSNFSRSYGLVIEDIIKEKQKSPDLTTLDLIFCLREMYRIAAIDKEIKEEELKVIDNFCKSFEISDEIKNVTKKWAVRIYEAEEAFDRELDELNINFLTHNN